MSLFSEGINKKANSSSAKNIPKNAKTQETKRRALDSLVKMGEINNGLLLLILEFIMFINDLCDLKMTLTQQKVFNFSFDAKVERKPSKVSKLIKEENCFLLDI